MSAVRPLHARRFLDSLFFSYAQILFSNRRWFGALLLAVTLFHPISGLLGFLGVLLSNIIAHLLKFDEQRIYSGFYGFNGILFGAAYGYYFTLTPFLLAVFPVFLVVTFLIAAVLEHHLAAAFNLPGLSLPFVLSLYILLIFFRNYGLLPHSNHAFAGLPVDGWLPEHVNRYAQSLAMLFYQPDVWAGLIIAAAILLFSRVLFGLSLLAYSANYLFVQWLLPTLGEPFLAASGLNAILVAFALGASLVIPSRKSLLLAIIGVLLTVILSGFFIRICNLTALPMVVLPFNFMVLCTLYGLKFRQHTSELVLLYFAPGSPEENFYYHHTSQARFEKLSYLFADLPVSGEWTVSQGHDGPTTHRADWQYAWDFVVTDDDGKSYQNSGTALEDFYAYRLPVCAPLDGEVVTIVDHIPNNKIGNVNLAQNWGNTIVIKHAEGLFSSLSHLEPESLRVDVGGHVKRGEILALCGSSGRSPEPHVHFQFQASAKIGEHTLFYPFGYYLEKENCKLTLHQSDVLVEGMKVQNLAAHRSLKNAFAFALGERFEFTFQNEKGMTKETWEVKVDAYNALYLESSAGAWANVFINSQMFYFTGFRGTKNCALYHFYVCASQVPLGFSDHMIWRDHVPLNKIFSAPARFIPEVFLIFGAPFRAHTDYQFGESPDHAGLIIQSRCIVEGRGIWRHLKRTSMGNVVLTLDDGIAEIEFAHGKKHFSIRRCRDLAA